MTDPQLLAGQEESPAQDGELTLIELLTAIGEEKLTIGLATLVGVAAGFAIAFLTTPVYTAKTTLLPPQQTQSASNSMAASLGALAATAGVVSAFKTPDELYVGLLRSDSVSNALIERFKLRERYDEQTLQETRKELGKKSRIATDRKSSLITVEVDDVDPAFSAQLANGYADELRKLMTRLAVTDAQQRRLFFEQQVEKTKTDLVRAEVAVKRAQEKSGLISLDAQTQSTIGSAAQIRGQIVAREVQIQAMRPYAGPDNPELRRLGSELSSLRAQLGKMESGGDTLSRVGKDDADALANVRIFRELKYQEAIYSAMVQQLQLARADEAKDAPLMQQVDMGLPPDSKSRPRRLYVILAATAAGLFAGLVLACIRRLVRNAKLSAKGARQWQAFVAAWSLRQGLADRASR